MTFIIFNLVLIALLYAMCFMIVSYRTRGEDRYKGLLAKEVNLSIAKETAIYTIIAIIIFAIFSMITQNLSQPDPRNEENQYIIEIKDDTDYPFPFSLFGNKSDE
jgi:heme/copper-type cytochrome/quinol oxidase subunit 2